MKITILSYYDWAGSGYKIYQAVKQHTDHDVMFFSEKYNVSFNHPHNTNYISDDFAAVQDRIDDSDIIHIKGDWPSGWFEFETGLVVSHKPIVQTVSGSHFRKKQFGGLETFKPFMFNHCALRTSLEPDLMYEDYKDAVLTPYPIDCKNKPIKWQRNDIPTFAHFPSNPAVKDTPFIIDVFKKISKSMRIKIIIPKGPVEFSRAMGHKMQSTIYFDQFGVGAYGNSTVEMLQYGIPVACWINGGNDSPILSTDKNVDLWADMIIEACNGDLEELSKQSKKYCDEVHSYEAVAATWDGLYKTIGKV